MKVPRPGGRSAADPALSEATVQDAPEPVEVVVLGSSNTDLVVGVPRLPRTGETVLGDRFYRAPGGKGANQAVAAARAGVRTAFIGCVGDDDLGRAARENLAREAIDLRALHTVEGVPSGVALILVDGQGRNLIAVAPGANGRLTPERVVEAEPLLAEARVLAAQLEVPPAAVLAAAERAAAHGTVVLLNPAPVPDRPLPDGLLRRVDVLVVNEEEAAALAGGTGGPAPDLEAAGRTLCARVAGRVVVTLGRKGGRVFEPGGGSWAYTAPAVEAVDTVGAGDCFCGWLAAGLARGRPFDRCVEDAARAAAISVTRRGAQPSMPRAPEVGSEEPGRLS